MRRFELTARYNFVIRFIARPLEGFFPRLGSAELGRANRRTGNLNVDDLWSLASVYTIFNVFENINLNLSNIHRMWFNFERVITGYRRKLQRYKKRLTKIGNYTKEVVDRK